MSKCLISLMAVALLLGSAAFSAQAQTQGAGTIHAQAQNTTIIHKAACGGGGRHCPPGRHWVCGPNHCWCAPC